MTEGYPPYSRLALERGFTAKSGGWGSGKRSILQRNCNEIKASAFNP